ncbi:MAG TPA: hypothetical protein VF322_07035 [Gammaproteobacteria bacterium]
MPPLRLGAALLLGAAALPALAQHDDFVPVTDAMLQNPDPADWLMWRRTPSLTPELRPGSANNLYVFALPD